MSWGILNQHQVRLQPQTNGGGNRDAIVDSTIHIVPLTSQDIQRGHKIVGLARVADCFIHRPYAELNGLPMENMDCTRLPDSNSTTCVVRVTLNKEKTIPEDMLKITCFWKKGLNPQGVQAEVYAELTVTEVDS